MKWYWLGFAVKSAIVALVIHTGGTPRENVQWGVALGALGIALVCSARSK